MNFVRKFALVLITPLFSLLLFATAFDMGVLRVAGQPSGVKQVLRDSGIYNNAVSSLLNQAKQDTSDNGDINLTNPTIVSAANATFTPQYIQQNTETVIDSIYAWLNGKTAQPDFNINLSSLKSKFADAAADAAQARAATLPACPDAASASLALSDPVAATCLPAGVTAAAVGSEVQGDLLGGKGFLDNVTLNADSIKNKSGQPIFSSGKLQNAPKQFQRVKKTPIILSLLSLLVALAIVFLSSSRRKGLRHLGVILLTVGIFMLLLGWGLNQAVTKEVPNLKLNNAVVQSDVQRVLTDLGHKISQNYYIFGGVYAVLGVLVLVAARFWGGKQPEAKDDLEGEGKNADDRIDLRAPDKPADVDKMQDNAAKKPAAAKPATAAPPAKKDIKVK